MPLKLIAFDDSPSCRGWTWAIRDSKLLARVVARLVMGQYLHADSLLLGRPAKQVALLQGAYLKVLRDLTQPKDVAHRDGWLFQMISWVAARTTDPKLLARAPQPRTADKGFDGIMVRRRAARNGAIYVVVCEDKATKQPRRVIRTEVWPSIRELESGARDNELLSEVTTLLSTVLPGAAAQDAVHRILWKDARRYRVSVTVAPERVDEARRKALFKGYRTVARGECLRRRGEMLVLDEMRAWMESFAEQVATELRRMRSRRV